LIPVGYESDGLILKVKLFRLIVSKYVPKFMLFFFMHNYLGERVLFDIEKSFRTKTMIFLIRKYHKIKYGV